MDLEVPCLAGERAQEAHVNSVGPYCDRRQSSGSCFDHVNGLDQARLFFLLDLVDLNRLLDEAALDQQSLAWHEFDVEELALGVKLE